ncbi:MAG: TetR/AcrR family transcriptional regulator [Planctomycetaceae bacterium]|jgi:AcrR family transcriptional regulator|nr:TetR/AcrR family transcriptional regulator [Planctomycetaceae bacterium]
MKDTKEHILKTSLRLFLQKNYKEVTMQEIVKETGLSKGAFYHYFTGKDKVFEEVVRYFYEYCLLADYRLYPTDSLKAFYNAYLDKVRRNMAGQIENAPEKSPFVMIIEALRRLPNLREIQEKEHAEELGYWKIAVKNAKKSREITTELSDETIARMFISLADGVLLHQTLSSQNFEDTVRELKKLYGSLFSLLES